LKIHDAYLPGSGPSHIKPTDSASQTAPAPAVRSESERKGAVGKADSIGLSDLSVRLLELVRVESPERAAHIERLAEQVRSGRYHVDALAVSRRIVDEALQG
jgi:anti-sigma28 factor (negative regulator of flagellin synthesis)